MSYRNKMHLIFGHGVDWSSIFFLYLVSKKERQGQTACYCREHRSEITLVEKQRHVVARFTSTDTDAWAQHILSPTCSVRRRLFYNRCPPHQLLLTTPSSRGGEPESPVAAGRTLLRAAGRVRIRQRTAHPRRPPAALMGKLVALAREAVRGGLGAWVLCSQ